LEDYVSCFDDALDLNRHAFHAEVAQDSAGGLPGSLRIRYHDPAFAEPRCASALAIRSVICALPRAVTVPSERIISKSSCVAGFGCAGSKSETLENSSADASR